MILVSRRAYGVARRTREETPNATMGPVLLRQPVHFSTWREDRPKADVFVDTGADHSWVSANWLASLPVVSRRGLPPLYGAWRRLLDDVALVFRVGGVTASLALHSPRLGFQRPACEPPHGLTRAEQASWRRCFDDPVRTMPGNEDILLGRDFLSHHGLLAAFEPNAFSLLRPHDAANQQRFDEVTTLLE